MSPSDASEHYKLPRSTLKNNLAGRHPGMREHPTTLAPEEEKTIIDHVIKLSEFGFLIDNLKSDGS